MSSSFAAHLAHHWFRRIVPRTALATLIGSLCTATLAANAHLTLQAAQQHAVAHSRQLAGKDYAAAAWRDMSVAASRLPDPVLKLGIDSVPVDGPDRFSLTRDFMTQRRIGVMQEITRADKRRLRAERFEREAEKSGVEKSSATAAIQRETALAWLDRYYAEAMAEVIAEQAVQAKLEIEAAESAYRGGRGSQAEIYAARSDLAMFDERASEVGRRIRNAQVMLARWTGLAVHLPLAGKPDIDALAFDTEAFETELAHHPDIALLAKQEEIASTEARLAQASKRADWSVELAYQQRGSAYSNMVSLGVSVPLQWDQKNRQDRELSSRLATLEQVKAEREEALRTHIAQTRLLLNEWANNRERHARYRRDIIPLANARTAATMAAYRGGGSSLSDVLAARRNEIDVRLLALQLEADTARLWAQLNFLFPHKNVSISSDLGPALDSK